MPKSEVKRVRIWDGNGESNEFDDSVLPFIARVEWASPDSEVSFQDGSSSWILVMSPDCESPPEARSVVVTASSRRAEELWKEFVHFTEFGGTGFAGDVARDFSKFLGKRGG